MKKPKYSDIDYTRIGQMIQNARKEKKVSQAKLAESIGCSVTHLCRIESGGRTSIDLLFPICQELDLSLDDLIGIGNNRSLYLKDLVELFERRPRHEQRYLLSLMQDSVEFMTMLEDRNLYHRFHSPAYKANDRHSHASTPVETILYSPMLAAEEPATFKRPSKSSAKRIDPVKPPVSDKDNPSFDSFSL